MFHNRVAISNREAVAVADVSDALPTGTFAVWSSAADTTIFVKVGQTVNDVDATNGYPVFANTVVHVATFEGERIGVTGAALIMQIN